MSDAGSSETWLTSNARICFILILGVISFIALLGNALVLAIAAKSAKMRTANNYFIFNLALCDVVVGCCGIPIMLTTMIAGGWIFGNTMCYIGAFLDNLVMMQSTWTLGALSAFRAMSVTNPLKFKQRGIRQKVVILLAVLWVLAGTFVASPCYGWSKYEYSPMTFNCGSTPGEGIHTYFFLVFMILVLFCPMFVVVTSYIIILYTALSNFGMGNSKRRCTSRHGPASKLYDRNLSIALLKQGDSTLSMMKSKRGGNVIVDTDCTVDHIARQSNVMASVVLGKLEKRKSRLSAKLRYFHSRSVKSSIRVLIIVGVFLLCVGPLLVIGFIMWTGTKIDITNKTGLIIYITALSHSAINPCVYGLCDMRFRDAYKSLFVRANQTFVSQRTRTQFAAVPSMAAEVLKFPAIPTQDTDIINQIT